MTRKRNRAAPAAEKPADPPPAIEPAPVEASAETVAVEMAGEQPQAEQPPVEPPAVEQPSTVAEAMENAGGVEAEEKAAASRTPLADLFEALAVEADAHPQGMQGLLSFDPPRALPEGVALEDGEYCLRGARWHWFVEGGLILRGAREDMEYFAGEAIELPEEAAA